VPQRPTVLVPLCSRSQVVSGPKLRYMRYLALPDVNVRRRGPLGPGMMRSSRMVRCHAMRRIISRAYSGVRVARFACAERGEVCWGVLPEGANAAEMGMSLQVAAPEAVAHGRLEPAGTRTVQKTLVPLPQQVPPAVVAVGLNYRAHAAEVGKEAPRFPIILHVNPASVCGGGPDHPIVCPPIVSRDPPELDYEAEPPPCTVHADTRVHDVSETHCPIGRANPGDWPPLQGRRARRGAFFSVRADCE